MEQQTKRNALLLWTTMHILRDTSGPLQPREAMALVAQQIELTPYELSTYDSGQSRWYVALGFITGNAATVLWVTKHGGRAALEKFSSASALYAEMTRLYEKIDQRRKQAQQNLGQETGRPMTTSRCL